MTKWLSVVLIALVCSGCDSGTKYRFTTFNDAKADKTIVGASLPEFVPSSARDIVGWYHVETNQQTAEFTFAPTDRDVMISMFAVVTDLNAACSNDKLHSRSWSDINKAAKFTFYTRKVSDSLVDCLSIDEDRSRAYYWVTATK
jgi:hypothetical protein